jgi:hypothetical protein
MWAIGISYGLLIVIGGLMALMGVNAARGGGAAAGGVIGGACLLGIVAIALIIFGIMYLLMLEKLGRRFKEQAQIARQSWAAAGAVQPAP